jgi:hypothetical protein
VAGGDDVGARWVVTGARAGAGGTGNQLERSKAVWAADRCAWPSKHFFSKFPNSLQTLQFNSNVFPRFKNLHALHGAIFEHIEQLFSLSQLQNPSGF